MSSHRPRRAPVRAPENLAVLLREPFRAIRGADRAARRRGHPADPRAHGMVFQYLDDAGTRVGVLAERAQMTKQSMAELVAHLERHGYVERVSRPGDGRASSSARQPAAARSSRSRAS